MSGKKEKLKEGWNFIGFAPVDSGQLMVCDPLYIDKEWKATKNNRNLSGKETGKFSYRGACQGTLNKRYSDMGLGVAFSSGMGDGIYPVYAKYANMGTKKIPDYRITEVKIDMSKMGGN